MAYKKIALAIDEKLVELCGDRFGYAKACGGSGNKGVQAFLPAAAADANAARVDLPSPPDFFVVHGLGATAIGRTLRGGDQLLSLHIEKGESDDAHSLHLQLRRKNRCSSSGIKIARTLYLLQYSGQLRGNGLHEWAPLNGSAHPLARHRAPSKRGYGSII